MKRTDRRSCGTRGGNVSSITARTTCCAARRRYVVLRRDGIGKIAHDLYQSAGHPTLRLGSWETLQWARAYDDVALIGCDKVKQVTQITAKDAEQHGLSRSAAAKFAGFYLVPEFETPAGMDQPLVKIQRLTFRTGLLRALEWPLWTQLREAA